MIHHDSNIERVRRDLAHTEISNLQTSGVGAGDGVDGEMGIDKTHLVEEALRSSASGLYPHYGVEQSTHFRDTRDHVLNHRLDGSETSDVFSGTVPDCEDDFGRFGGLDLCEGQR